MVSAVPGGKIGTLDVPVIFLVSLFHRFLLALETLTSFPATAHSYVYSFEPNPAWSAFYAPASEIQSYLQKVYDKYSVGRFVKLRHKIVGCKWEPEQCKWYVIVQSDVPKSRCLF